LLKMVELIRVGLGMPAMQNNGVVIQRLTNHSPDATVSPEPGTDRNGPTSLIKSATSAIDCIKYAHNHFNMKFHPSAFQSLEGKRKFLSLIKTYMDLGGHHTQFNVIDANTLKDAQLHPENYRDLVVREAGFSAFSIILEKFVQEEIIKRREYRFEGV